MKKIIFVLFSILIFNSCCDTKTIEDYDHVYDNYLPEKGTTTLSFYNSKDTSIIEKLTIIDDRTETEDIKVNGDGCRMKFIVRTLEFEIPKIEEQKFLLSTFRNSGSIKLSVGSNNSYNSLSYVYHDYMYEDDIVEYECFYNSFKIAGTDYENVMQFVSHDSNFIDLKKIFLVENYGIMQLTYYSGDTLIRK